MPGVNLGVISADATGRLLDHLYDSSVLEENLGGWGLSGSLLFGGPLGLQGFASIEYPAWGLSPPPPPADPSGNGSGLAGPTLGTPGASFGPGYTRCDALHEKEFP
jgi:hypothetical protein